MDHEQQFSLNIPTMEFYCEILKSICRLCGSNLSKDSRDKKDLKSTVKQICGIDHTSDLLLALDNYLMK